MRKHDNIWENNISDKKKAELADALGIDLQAQASLHVSLADVGKAERIAEAKRQCEARRKRREASENIPPTTP